MNQLRINADYQLNIPEEHWELTGGWDPDVPDWVRVTGPILWILGVPHHIEGYAVTDVGGIQHPAHPAIADELAALWQLNEAALQSVTLFGWEYVLVIYPHGD
jgi:hypothetical protein